MGWDRVLAQQTKQTVFGVQGKRLAGCAFERTGIPTGLAAVKPLLFLAHNRGGQFGPVVGGRQRNSR